MLVNIFPQRNCQRTWCDKKYRNKKHQNFFSVWILYLMKLSPFTSIFILPCLTKWIQINSEGAFTTFYTTLKPWQNKEGQKFVAMHLYYHALKNDSIHSPLPSKNKIADKITADKRQQFEILSDSQQKFSPSCFAGAWVLCTQ